MLKKCFLKSQKNRVNIRPGFLQRALQPDTLEDDFRAFDQVVSSKLMDIADIPQQERSDAHHRVSVLRGLPLSIGGLGVPLMSSISGRLYAFVSANDRMARYLDEVHPELLLDVIDSRMSGSATICQIEPRTGFDEVGARPEQRHLGGHPLGNIPEAKINTTQIDLKPELCISRGEVMQKIVKIRAQMQHIAYTQLLNDLRADQNKNELVAQSLSSAVVGSGAVFRWFPVPGYTMKCDHFQELLRTRLCFSALQWSRVNGHRCRCNHRIPTLDPDDSNSGEHQDMQRSIQPLHGLNCRKEGCAGRVIRRHADICRAIEMELSRLQDVQVYSEPYIDRRSGMRSDLKIVRHGKCWFVDVGVTNAGTPANVNRGAHKECAVAAKVYFDAKLDKYAPKLGGIKRDSQRRKYVDGFMPFIIETGGRMDPRSVEWLDKLLADAPAVRRACYRSVSNVLCRAHGKMLSKYKETVL